MATLFAPKQFSPVEDAESIKKACLGWGTDEKAIISILGHRNLFQRKLIRLAYEEIYQEDLIHQLKSELSGDLEKAICLWTLDPADRDALLAKMALETRVPDFLVILEIACVSSPEELLAIKRAYRFRYKHSLEEDVASHTTGDIRIRKLLVAIISTYKYDGEEFDEEVAHSEANVLRDEITGKIHNHDELIRILTTRSKSQLKATFNKYKDIHSTSITKDMSGSPTDDLYFYALRTAIRCIKDPKKYFAKILRNAIKMEDTDEDALSRVIVNRAEKDLKEINELFVRRNSTSLEEAVSQHTSGDYKTFLLTLLGYEGI